MDAESDIRAGTERIADSQMSGLRPYQINCVNAVLECAKESNSVLYCMPTGTGKTQTFVRIAEQFIRHGRIMVVAHRDELIQQAARRFHQMLGEKPEIEMGDSWASDSLFTPSSVVVASVQSLIAASRGERRMTRFSPGAFSCLIIDEAHHGTANSYRTVIEHFRQNPDLKVIGCTATPDRADEEALGQIFESVAFEYEVLDAINDGWLVPIVQQMVHVKGLDFSAMRTTAGDLNGADLSAAMEAEEKLHAVAAPTAELCKTRKALVFACSIKQAEMLCEILNRYQAGSACAVFGHTPEEIRRKTLADFDAGVYRTLVNVGIATEGWDCPTVDAIIMARPTKSRALYAQMIGRGFRPILSCVQDVESAEDRKANILASQKPDVLVLDFSGNSGRHKLIHAADILGGKYSDEVVELAKREIYGKPQNVQSALDEAKRHLDIEKAKAEEAARRAAIKAKATYSTQSVSPFHVLGIEPLRPRGWDAQKPISAKQRAILEKGKIDPDIPEARQILNAYFKHCAKAQERTGEWGCTINQMRFLRKHGYDPVGLSINEASALFDRIKANGWRRPDPLPPPEMQSEQNAPW